MLGAKELRGPALGAIAATAVSLWMPPALADTLDGALVLAYQNNPTLNAQRASARATDEGVPQALSGYRPRVSFNGSVGAQYSDSTTRSQTLGNGNTYTQLSGNMTPSNFGLTATQTLYNGFQTSNRTRQAESQVQAAREQLRVSEQAVLLSAVTAYMNLLRDAAILDLQRRNVEVLQEQLRQTRDRFNVGEVTRTDVAQSESRLASGRSQVLSAEATYKASVATYRQVIGVEPGRLAPGSPVDRFSPHTLPASVGVGTATHPAVTNAQYNVDAALLQVKVAEGALYPTLALQGNVQQSYETSLLGLRAFNASVIGQLTVPIYQGGAEYSLIRQAKETLGQRRLDLEIGARSGAAERGAVVGAAGRGESQYRGDAGAGAGERDRAQRGARGSAGWPAHDARRLERATGTGERAGGAGERAARPGGCLLLALGGGRAAVAAGARAAGAGL